MIMKIAFYKKSKTFFGRLIRIKQRYWDGHPKNEAQYSHVELVFSNNVAFSSSECDGGTRFKVIEWNPKHWDFVEVKVTEEQERKIQEFCTKENGQAYNWIGIFFAQFLNFNINRKGDWFCSQIVCRALQEVCLFCGESAHFVTPAKLKKLTK